MKLYTDAHGNWRGTQAEAKKDLDNWQTHEVPTSKQELLAFLNAHKVGDCFKEDKVQSQVDSLELSPTDKSNIKTAFEQAGAAREAMRRVFDQYDDL